MRSRLDGSFGPRGTECRTNEGFESFEIGAYNQNLRLSDFRTAGGVRLLQLVKNGVTKYLGLPRLAVSFMHDDTGVSYVLVQKHIRAECVLDCLKQIVRLFRELRSRNRFRLRFLINGIAHRTQGQSGATPHAKGIGLKFLSIATFWLNRFTKRVHEIDVDVHNC